MYMQYYYGEQNILRALDEAEFWKHQEAEHTTVIQLVTPNLEKQYVIKLKEFEEAFNNVQGYLVRYVQSAVRSKGVIDEELKKEITNCIVFCIKQSKQFVGFLDELLKESEAVQRSIPSQTVINHISRESQYFIGIDQLILNI